MSAAPVASLAMYDLPQLRPAIDRLWQAIRDRMRADGIAQVPDALAHDRPLEAIWRDPALVLAQTCGLPFMTTLRETVRLVATPCYDLPGCDGADYCSLIIVRSDHPAQRIADLRGGIAAINGWNSQSGMSALRAVVAPIAGGPSFFRRVLVTGAHRDSLHAVRTGAADIAAIDCVTHGLLADHAPGECAGTRVLCRSPTTPGLPLVTAAATRDEVVQRMIAALEAVMDDPSLASVRAILHIKGIARLTAADYAPIRTMGEAAAARGYPALG
ncbi:MAG: PhnD/SsuA/transferrin family substrate-binding protein [Proteobacteria bacterium]|nr:PhnD/SsuA/transferrin family substrate-binding protein [Pseudomonadota bacterium]